MENTRKRARDDDDNDSEEDGLQSLSRPISPPPKKPKPSEEGGEGQEARKQENPGHAGADASASSPWQLTWIRDLPEDHNRHAVTLRDLLGNPLISECWEFNYLHDVGFLMNAFDPDTRHLVKVHIVHGFWKQEDPQRLRLTVRTACLLKPRKPLLTDGRTKPLSSAMLNSMWHRCPRCLVRTTAR